MSRRLCPDGVEWLDLVLSDVRHGQSDAHAFHYHDVAARWCGLCARVGDTRVQLPGLSDRLRGHGLEWLG